jgi:beta-glucosidase
MGPGRGRCRHRRPGFRAGWRRSLWARRRRPRSGEPEGDISISFNLRNTSNRAGAEVAQVYIGRLPTRFVATPPRQLAGFARADLAAKTTQPVTVTIPRRSLSYWDTGAQRWVTPAGQVPVYVGGSSEDTALAGAITVR